MYIKIITGFRKEQKYTIPAEEAHKAYYLFLNPDKRGVFSNGVAVEGSTIKGIEPDYHATMGWNETHILDGDDWNEIASKNIDRKMQAFLSKGKEVGYLASGDIKVLATPLELPKPQDSKVSQLTAQLAEKMKA